MMEQLSEFHFIRPLWLLGLLPVLILLAILWRYRQASLWQRIIDSRVMATMLSEGSEGRGFRWLTLLLPVGWMAGVLALAGPAWQKIQQPLEIRKDALVILLDLSSSMQAQDVEPSRIERAQFKLTDLLRRRTEGQTALIVYAGDAHIVVPFTDDTKTLHNLLPALHPTIMPVPGSRTDLGLQAAGQLLKDNQITRGRVLLITDSVEDLKDAANDIPQPHDFVVIGVGTETGGPIPGSRNGGFVQNRQGKTVIARLSHTNASRFVRAAGGVYSPLTLDDTDLSRVLPERWWEGTERENNPARQHDLFVDSGYWLLLLCLPLLLSLFRRGVLASFALAFVILLQFPTEASAEEAKDDLGWWQKLLYTDDEKGYWLLQQGEAEKAAEQFDDPQWRAAAEYENGDYQKAIDFWTEQNNAVSDYNKGNALARQGRFAEALESYQKAIDQQEDMEDAHYNKALVEKLLEQQQQQQSASSGDSGEGSEDKRQGEQTGEGQDNSQQAGRDQEQQESSQARRKQDEGSQEEEAKSTEQQASRPSENTDEQERSQSLEDQLEAEGKLSLNQWLQRIPDNPGGLLKRKFRHESRQRRNWLQAERNQNKTW